MELLTGVCGIILSCKRHIGLRNVERFTCGPRDLFMDHADHLAISLAHFSELFLSEMGGEFLDKQNHVVDGSAGDVAARLDCHSASHHSFGGWLAVVHSSFKVSDPEAVHVDFEAVQSLAGGFCLSGLCKIDVGNLSHLGHVVFYHELAVLRHNLWLFGSGAPHLAILLE